MSNPANWKIIRILDEYHVIVNVGKEDLKVGDELEVFVRGVEVKDPDSGEALGHVTYPKATLKVIQVQERLAVAENSEQEFIPDPEAKARKTAASIQESLARLTDPLSILGLPSGRHVTKRLKVDPGEVEGGWEADIPKEIKVGDPVRKIERR